MSNPTSDQSDQSEVFTRNALEATIRIGAVALIVVWCFEIIRPFLVPILGGMIIAIAIYPAYQRLVERMGDRRKTASVLFACVGLALIITPTVIFSGSIVETVQTLNTRLNEGSLKIPPPSDSVKEWPVIGERLYGFWNLASTNLEAAINRAGPGLKTFGAKLLAAAGGAGMGLLQFIFSIIVAAVFLTHAQGGNKTASTIATRFAPGYGASITKLATATIRSVAQGVVGVAFIQAVLAGIGLIAMDVPGAGLWALLVLLVAIIQLPPLIILGPIVIYVFSVADTVPAIIFMIWSFLVSASDAVLKPLLLGRGVEVPMLVILVGALGGMMMSGLIGLFVGSVVLALGYKLFMRWLTTDAETSPQGES